MRSLEDQLAEALRVSAARLPHQNGTAAAAMRRARELSSHRRKRRLLASMVGLTVIVFSYFTGWPPIPVGRSMVVASGPSPTDDAIVTIAYLQLPAAHETVPGWPGGAMYFGKLGPEPRFDKAGLEADQTLVQSTPAVVEPWFGEGVVPRSTDLPGIYLGDLAGGLSVSLTPGRPCCGLDGLVEAIFDPVPTVCVYIGDADSIGYRCYDVTQLGTDTINVTSRDGSEEHVAAWFHLPDSAAVVALERNGEVLAWQRPISRTAVFKIPVEEVTHMLAFDSQGNLLAETDIAGPLGPGSPSPSTTITPGT